MKKYILSLFTIILRNLIITSQCLPDNTSSPENQTNSEAGSSSSGLENGSMMSSSNSYVTDKETVSNNEVCLDSNMFIVY